MKYNCITHTILMRHKPTYMFAASPPLISSTSLELDDYFQPSSSLRSTIWAYALCGERGSRTSGIGPNRTYLTHRIRMPRRLTCQIAAPPPPISSSSLELEDDPQPSSSLQDTIWANALCGEHDLRPGDIGPK